MKKILTAGCLMINFSCQYAQYQDGATWRLQEKNGYEKIIISTPGSPAHCMLFIDDVNADTLIRASYTSVISKNGKFTPTILLASFKGYEQMKSDLSISEAGDKQTIKGTIIFPGNTINIDETYTRIIGLKRYKGPFNGAWKIISSSYKMPDGTTLSDTAGTKTILLINPTHWMRLVTKNNNDFTEAFGGTQTVEGDKIISQVDFASQKNKKGNKAKINWKVVGNKMFLTGIVNSLDGTVIISFTEVFQKTLD